MMLNRFEKWLRKGFFKPVQTIFLLASLCIAIAGSLRPASAGFSEAPDSSPQPQTAPKAIDMMIVIDNSCSMFPESIGKAVCNSYGSDPDFLRITGADLFLARLGFAEPNEEEYQAGVISLGDTAEIISDLQPLHSIRDEIARRIRYPSPEPATRLVLSLEQAYDRLRSSPNRKASNLPAVVLITDGIPWPAEGQSYQDVQALVEKNPDIPLFIMLLQDPEKPNDAEYKLYGQFWERMAATHSAFVNTYSIKSADQIEATYNEIVARLQDTVPSDGAEVTPNNPYSFFVSKYVQRIVVTIVHQQNQNNSQVEIQDPHGKQVSFDDAKGWEDGVKHFRGQENPVEVISIYRPRLDPSLKDDFWTISSNTPVRVFLDRQGAYRIQFSQPTVTLTGLVNVYHSTDRQPADGQVNIHFQLMDENEQVVLEPQPISAMVSYLEGNEKKDKIVNTNGVAPDSQGIYSLRFVPSEAAPSVAKQSMTFTLMLNAGSANEPNAQVGQEVIPIARAKLIMEAGPGPYINLVEPSEITCQAGQSNTLRVTLGGIDSIIEGTVRLRLFSSNGADLQLQPAAGQKGVYEASTDSICTGVSQSMTCDNQARNEFNLRLSAEMKDGSPLPPLERKIPVSVMGEACPTATATVTPTPPPTPVPTATPIPDSDNDMLNDVIDQCVNEAGVGLFNGCPPPVWAYILGGLLLAGVLAFLILWFIPWMRVVLNPPPEGYVQVVVRGEQIPSTPKSLYRLGMKNRASRIRIGSAKQATVVIRQQNVKPIEAVVMREGQRNVVKDPTLQRVIGFVDDTVTTLYTSNPDVKLLFSLKQELLALK